MKRAVRKLGTLLAEATAFGLVVAVFFYCSEPAHGDHRAAVHAEEEIVTKLETSWPIAGNKTFKVTTIRKTDETMAQLKARHAEEVADAEATWPPV